MITKIVQNLFYIVLIIFSTGCSLDYIQQVTPTSNIQRSESIIVMRVFWYDEFRELKHELIKTTTSQKIVQDFLKKTDFPNHKKRLPETLYHLSNFRFELESKSIDSQWFRKSDLFLDEYKPISIYALKPTTITLKQFLVDEKRFFQPQKRSDEIELNHTFLEEYSLPSRSWDLKAGKVVYLGDLHLYFKTKKESFGLFFDKKEAVKDINLVRVRWDSKYKEVKKQLEKEKKWFPTRELSDLSQQALGDWEWSDEKWIPYQKKMRKKDLKKFFF
ncbi:MAG: hypothetical protein ACI86H_000429 [bacterium]|jgi:hypothetical protein